MKLATSLLCLAASAFAQQQKWTYPIPSDDAVTLRKDIEFLKTGDVSLKLDLYLPKTAADRMPVVFFLNGIGSSDFKRWTQYTGWGKLTAGNGMAAVTFDTH